MKRRKNTYHLGVSSGNKAYWFQFGKMYRLDELDSSKNFSSHKSFRTRKKLESFLRYLDIAFPNVDVEVWESQRHLKLVHYFTIKGG